MSNARAALYAYRAQADRATATTFRKFGYFASADAIARRAERFERMAQSEGAPPESTDGAPCAASQPIHELDDDLHTTPDSEKQSKE